MLIPVRTRLFAACMLLPLGLLTPGSSAQTPIDASKVSPFATGLQGPRGMAFGPDGLLYVAEGGTGGTNSTVGSCLQVPSPVGPYTGGATARISRVDSSGKVTVLATGLPSAADAVGDIAGVADVAFLGDSLYAVLAGGGCSHGNPTLPNGIVKVNVKNGNWKYITDLSVFYAEHPAAYPDEGDFEADGQPYSLLAYNGELFSVEANHGQLVRTTPQGVNTLVADISYHLGHIVPTGLTEANGNLYVSSLGQFPVASKWEKLLTFSKNMNFVDTTPGLATPASELKGFRLAAVRAGLTGALNLKVGPDGLLYALEFMTNSSDFDPPQPIGDPTKTTVPACLALKTNPCTGQVVRLTQKGVWETVVYGLTVPTGMAFGPDNALYVANFGDLPPGQGQILRLPIPM